jgi:hypothetical protein
VAKTSVVEEVIEEVKVRDLAYETAAWPVIESVKVSKEMTPELQDELDMAKDLKESGSDEGLLVAKATKFPRSRHILLEYGCEVKAVPLPINPENPERLYNILIRYNPEVAAKIVERKAIEKAKRLEKASRQ